LHNGTAVITLYSVAGLYTLDVLKEQLNRAEIDHIMYGLYSRIRVSKAANGIKLLTLYAKTGA
jgi:hypothetical protein